MIINQKIFKGSYVSQLREDLISRRSLEGYFSEEFSPPENSIMETSVKVESDNLELLIPESGDPANADFDNAIKIYEAYRTLNETQASDPRLWIYLSHCTFRKYVMKRWGISKNYDEIIAENSLADKAIESIKSHWFAGGNDRYLRRNAIARLWWATYLTASPWRKDPEYFSGVDVTNEYPYRYTKILFSTQDVFQQVLERGIGRDSHILISVLECIEKNPNLKREQIRNIMKELNLTSSIKNISILNKNELSEFISEIIPLE